MLYKEFYSSLFDTKRAVQTIDSGEFQTRMLASEFTLPGATTQDGTKLALSRHQVDLLTRCLETPALKEPMILIGMPYRTKYRHQVLKPLLDANIVEMTLPDKTYQSPPEVPADRPGPELSDATGAAR